MQYVWARSWKRKGQRQIIRYTGNFRFPWKQSQTKSTKSLFTCLQNLWSPQQRLEVSYTKADFPHMHHLVDLIL